ncbi:MAG: hypothetical protein Q8L19_05570 [Reyranella sp.]|nr:hypothetical protein [Reyranella sp.]
MRVKLSALAASKIFFYRIDFAVFNMLLIEGDRVALRKAVSDCLFPVQMGRIPRLPCSKNAFQPDAYMHSLCDSK